MKTLIIGLLFISGLAKAQSCSPPKPLTDEQKAMVAGKWVGHYEVAGVKRDFSVVVDFTPGIQALTISNPPSEGSFTDENLRFCHNGAFHFGKNLADGYFEFDGVPNALEIKGLLVVLTKGGRKTGEFVLRREEGAGLKSIQSAWLTHALKGVAIKMNGTAHPLPK